MVTWPSTPNSAGGHDGAPLLEGAVVAAGEEGVGERRVRDQAGHGVGVDGVRDGLVDEVAAGVEPPPELERPAAGALLVHLGHRRRDALLQRGHGLAVAAHRNLLHHPAAAVLRPPRRVVHVRGGDAVRGRALLFLREELHAVVAAGDCHRPGDLPARAGRHGDDLLRDIPVLRELRGEDVHTRNRLVLALLVRVEQPEGVVGEGEQHPAAVTRVSELGDPRAEPRNGLEVVRVVVPHAQHTFRRARRDVRVAHRNDRGDRGCCASACARRAAAPWSC